MFVGSILCRNVLALCIMGRVQAAPTLLQTPRGVAGTFVPPPPPPPPVLTWPVTYNMSRSTFSNPDGNSTGFDSGLVLARDAQYGIITFDGEFQLCLHSRDGPPGDPCKYKSTQANAEKQARNIKAINPFTRVFTYHNQEEALLRRQQDCLIMNDPAYTDYFLLNGSQPINNRLNLTGRMSMCADVAPPSAYTHEDQYALDFRKPKVAQWWLENVIGDFINSTVLDGFYWDCPTVTAPFGNLMSPTEVADVNAAMAATRATAQARIAAAGKWALGMFRGLPTPNECPIACSLWWYQSSSNCSKACDKSPQTCTQRVQSAAAAGAQPSTMTIPYVRAGDAPNAVTCTSPAAVVDLNGIVALTLSCLPGTGVLDVTFASYGTPLLTSTNGRFIRCSQPGCTNTQAVYWENLASGVVYMLQPGLKDDCTKCLVERPQSCNVTSVTADHFSTLVIALEKFSCRVQRECVHFAADPSCDAGPAVLAAIQSHCNGQQSCVIPQNISLPSPPAACGGGAQNWRLAVRASGCTQGTAAANFREHLAAFLLVRGPHSWMGHDWIAGEHPAWYPEWDVDYGEPMGPMKNNGGVFSRQWSKMNVSLDCNSFTAEFNPTAST
eukprot:m.37525 g.37525  ORF g.37525 m.37525 type:complete len:610 (-) comp7711_c0_seq1:210-2039(-)